MFAVQYTIPHDDMWPLSQWFVCYWQQLHSFRNLAAVTVSSLKGGLSQDPLSVSKPSYIFPVHRQSSPEAYSQAFLQSCWGLLSIQFPYTHICEAWPLTGHMLPCCSSRVKLQGEFKLDQMDCPTLLQNTKLSCLEIHKRLIVCTDFKYG